MTGSSSNGQQNGRDHITAKLADGIYIPTVAFFTPEDTVDTDTTRLHVARLAQADIAGIVTHGSTGEAVHLDRDERQAINRVTRSALDAAGKPHLPVIAGCGAQSTKEAIQLCCDAAESGASHALVLPPAYYASLLTTELVLQHFLIIADASPIPLLIYNFPAAAAGLDLSSDSILTLAKHPNIIGVKLTCGNTGKLARVVAGTRGSSFKIFGGSVDFTLQTLSVGGHGTIGGLANIFPKTCVRVMKLWKMNQTEETIRLQATVAEADWVAIRGGFVVLKAALEHFFGYGGLPRRPCVLPAQDVLGMEMRHLKEIAQHEQDGEYIA